MLVVGLFMCRAMRLDSLVCSEPKNSEKHEHLSNFYILNLEKKLFFAVDTTEQL